MGVAAKYCIGMKIRKQNVIFACQITDTSFDLLKISQDSKREILGLESEGISAGIDDKQLAPKLKQLLKKLEYSNNLLIFSLPRSKVTCRYLKVPTQIPEEIERILALQASRYLPYPVNELITAYQTISFDKEGCSEVSLIIAHKDVISRYTGIAKELNIQNFKIVLSSVGLGNSYSYITPQEDKRVMVVDIGLNQTEVVVIYGSKLLFSRSFKLAQGAESRQSLFIEEINRTKNAYMKEILSKPIEKAVILGSLDKLNMTAEVLSREIAIPVEALAYQDKISLKETLPKTALGEGILAALIGLGLKEIEETLNLLPQDLKEINKKISRQNEALRMALSGFIILLIFGLSLAKNSRNKEIYLEKLKIEAQKIEKESRPLEELEKKIKFMDRRLENTSSVLDMLYTLGQAISSQVSLVNFIYEEDNRVGLRGEAKELSAVYDFVNHLEKSAVFKGFNIKLRYAVNRKTAQGEIVDFEIAGSKK